MSIIEQVNNPIDLFEDLIDKDSEIIHYKLIVVVMVKVGLGRCASTYGVSK